MKAWGLVGILYCRHAASMSGNKILYHYTSPIFCQGKAERILQFVVILLQTILKVRWDDVKTLVLTEYNRHAIIVREIAKTILRFA
jgi:hypothetical protein